MIELKAYEGKYSEQNGRAIEQQDCIENLSRRLKDKEM